MHVTSGKLQELVRRLDALASPPSLVDLADAFRAVSLSLDDVAPYIEENPRGYNRALVALGEHYELLVMTWLPGQASPPHDHAGSICVMQVLGGEAIEGQFRVAPDGYVDPDYESVVPRGEVTAGQDAGVHVVRNPDDAPGPLVTLHAYAPPLRDFRRFVPRPSPAVRVTRTDPTPTVVVVGAGFSGSMAAAQLLRGAAESRRKLRVMVAERRGALGEGVAYGSRELAHLLNVPAIRMSAWPDRPDDFVSWATDRNPLVRPDEFLPRMWYGQYVRETLLATADAAAPYGTLQVVFDEVRRVARRPSGGWLAHFSRGKSQHADAVILAVGHRPPSDPFGKRWNGPRTRFIADPWRPFALNVVRPEESVVVLGSGLTAIDAVLSLAHPSRRAPITLLSRRGLLPQAHAATPPKPVDLRPLVTGLTATPGGVRVIDLLRGLRRLARVQTSLGLDWRGVVDGLRPHTTTLWQAMPEAQRKRFLARLQPFWEVHRHRMALSIAERFGELRDCEWISVVAARVLSVHAEQDAAHLIAAERGSTKLLEIDADWVVNCTGPAPSNSAASNPAIGSLLVDGWLRADTLNLGVDTTPQGTAIDRSGRIVPDLFVVGTLRKPLYWESTAVPELRDQAAAVAQGALSHVASQALTD